MKIPWVHLDPPECHGVRKAYVRISHNRRGTKFDVHGTKQHKSSTKFTVLQILENSLGTLRPTRMPQCTHGIMSESATRSMAQNSAYTAQNSTKVAQNSRSFRTVKIAWEHLDPPECHGVHMAYVRISHNGRGTKFGVCGTKQHKISTKFTVIQILENSLGTLRPTRMQQCTHGIMSESATKSMAQSSAHTAQNSTK